MLVVPTAVARNQAALHRILAETQTWGELRELITAENYQHCVEFRKGAEEDEDGNVIAPGPRSRFEPTQISSFGEMEWPMWLALTQLDWVPKAS